MADNSPILIGRNNSASNPGNETSLSRNEDTSGTVFVARNLNNGGGIRANATNGVAVWGSSDSSYGVYASSTGGHGLRGDSVSGYGVLGDSRGTLPAISGTNRGTGAGVEGRGDDSLGVEGRSISGTGVRGTSGSGTGVRGVSTSEERGFGVVAQGRVAGFFAGPVNVFGDLTVFNGNKPFKIDHPLDPQNKYLLHNAVESPERKNVYDGLARLDEDGQAWVELPEWFEALNGDVRYQLTALGGSAPNLHVAEEVSENRFKIAGGEEGMKVCWQLTGSRKDPWAAANPFEVEQEKPQEERGRYLDPSLYDAPEEQRIMMEPPRPEAVEEEQRPPEPSGIDFARLDPDSASLYAPRPGSSMVRSRSLL
jgi:hypothetical protein